MIRYSRMIVSLLMFLAFSAGLTAQPFQLTDSLSLDPGLIMGRLDNGIVYYIRQNKKPENRVELRLAVNAGSMQENDSQKGLAHFTEHMCFNGTTNFPKNELVDYLQQTGVKFGADINAYTSFDETVYMLQLPADKPELLDKGFQVIEDWAHQVTFEGEEIDKERGIIIEEWRMGLGADDRIRKKYFPLIFKGSRYAERMPIGDIEVLKNFHHDTIRKFYKDWYRPDLQAVVVVGDIDPALAEQKIREHFSRIPKAENPRPRVSYSIPENKEPLVALVTDREATSTSVMIFYKHPRKLLKTVGDYRNKLIGELFTGMLNERLREYQQKPDAPFIYAYNYYGGFLARGGDAYTVVASIKENMINQAIGILLMEGQRVRLHGFLASEFARVREDMLMRYEKQAKEYDKTESGRLAGQYVSHYLSGNPVPGTRAEFAYVKNLIGGISLEEVNALAGQWMTEENMAVVVTAPEKPEITVPNEEMVLNMIRESRQSKPEAWVDQFRDEPLIDRELTGSPLASAKKIENLGATEMTLKNGIRIVVKKTDFKNDEILFSAISPGGTSLFPDQDYMSALFAAQIIGESGLGKFNNLELKKKLKGKSIELSPYIDDVREGFNGKTNPRDLETLLQLTYLYFTAAVKDSNAFLATISRTKNQMKFVGNNPVFAFMDTLIKTSSSNDPRVVVLPKEKQLDNVRLDLAYSMYRDRFANAGDFVFYFVGNIDADSSLPLFEKYLGSLPVTGREENWKDESAPFPPGATDVKIYKGSEPKSMVGIIFQKGFEWNGKNRLHLRMLKEIVSIRLIETIREEMSGVYSPRVQMSTDKFPKSEFSLMIQFGCSPDNTDRLTDAIFGIFEDLRKKGPGDKDLKKVQELLLRERETDVKNNKWWLTRIEGIYFLQDENASDEEYLSMVRAVTSNDLRTAARQFFIKDHYVRVVLFPEKQ